jgi:hypothetical protein
VTERPDVRWDDIVGLDKAKQALHEAVVLPSLRADLFQVRPPVQKVSRWRIQTSQGRCMSTLGVSHRLQSSGHSRGSECMASASERTGSACA